MSVSLSLDFLLKIVMRVTSTARHKCFTSTNHTKVSNKCFLNNIFLNNLSRISLYVKISSALILWAGVQVRWL